MKVVVSELDLARERLNPTSLPTLYASLYLLSDTVSWEKTDPERLLS